MTQAHAGFLNGGQCLKYKDPLVGWDDCKDWSKLENVVVEGGGKHAHPYAHGHKHGHAHICQRMIGTHGLLVMPVMPVVPVVPVVATAAAVVVPSNFR